MERLDAEWHLDWSFGAVAYNELGMPSWREIVRVLVVKIKAMPQHCDVSDVWKMDSHEIRSLGGPCEANNPDIFVGDRSLGK